MLLQISKCFYGDEALNHIVQHNVENTLGFLGKKFRFEIK
jgi:hypothetical protein